MTTDATRLFEARKVVSSMLGDMLQFNFVAEALLIEDVFSCTAEFLAHLRRQDCTVLDYVEARAAYSLRLKAMHAGQLFSRMAKNVGNLEQGKFVTRDVETGEVVSLTLFGGPSKDATRAKIRAMQKGLVANLVTNFELNIPLPLIARHLSLVFDFRKMPLEEQSPEAHDLLLTWSDLSLEWLCVHIFPELPLDLVLSEFLAVRSN